jgi:hypothetical protein
MFYIRHLINTKNGKKIVEFQQVISEKCNKCRKDVPQVFYGKDNNSLYSVNAIYKYSVKDIEGELTNTVNGSLPKLCNRSGCAKYRY